ncbi:MAG: hypothetical protein WDA75_07475 [Candidatus Latescibacterota bacterium]|jgi:hypothetical protein
MLARTAVTITLLAAVCFGQLAAQEYRPEDFLPLAVGNSWTYRHSYMEMREDAPLLEAEQELTTVVTGTEVIDGQTYYVFSGPEYTFPPIPWFSLAGKKVRWADDGALMVLRLGGEVALFRFDVQEPRQYPITSTESDTLVRSFITSGRVLLASFDLMGHNAPGEDRGVFFRQFYGMAGHAISVWFTDVPDFMNKLDPIRAVLDGRAIEYIDAVRPTAVSASSWGRLKVLRHRY